MNEKLTLNELIDLLATKANISKKEAEAFLRELFVVVSENIYLKDTVKIKDFGTFKLVKVNARKSIDVNTGREIEIMAHYKLSFIPDKELRDIVNKPFAHFESVLLNDEISFPDLEDKVTKMKEDKKKKKNKQKVVTSMKSTIVGLASAFNKKIKEEKDFNVENTNYKEEEILGSERQDASISQEKDQITDTPIEANPDVILTIGDDVKEKANAEQFDNSELISKLYNITPSENEMDETLLSQSNENEELNSNGQKEKDMSRDSQNMESEQDASKDKKEIVEENNENKNQKFLEEDFTNEEIQFYPIIVEDGMGYEPINNVEENSTSSEQSVVDNENEQQVVQPIASDATEEIEIPKQAESVDTDTEKSTTGTPEENNLENSMIGEAIAAAVDALDEIPAQAEDENNIEPLEDKTSMEDDDGGIWPWMKQEETETVLPSEQQNNDLRQEQLQNANQINLENDDRDDAPDDSLQEDKVSEVPLVQKSDSYYGSDISEQTDKDMDEMEEGRLGRKGSSGVLMFVMALIAIIILFLVVFFWISQRNKNNTLASEFGYENEANTNTNTNEANATTFPNEDSEEATIPQEGDNVIAPMPNVPPSTSIQQSTTTGVTDPDTTISSTQSDSMNRGVNGALLPTDITMQPGSTLRLLSEEYYGNKIFWVYIYEENKDVIRNPNSLSRGMRLVIPSRAKYDIDATKSESVRKASNLQNELYRQFP